MTNPGTRSSARANFRRLFLTCALLLTCTLAPFSASADSSGGSFSAYPAAQQASLAATVWSPLFRSNFQGWSSTLVVHNETNAALNLDIAARTVQGALTNRSLPLAANATRNITGADLGVADGFNGSVNVITTGNISGVILQDNPTANRISLLSPDNQGSTQIIPLAFNDYNGWTSVVSVMSFAQEEASVQVTFRVEGKPALQRTIRVPGGMVGNAQLDFAGVEKGPMSIEFDTATVGAFGPVQLTAAAYHIRNDGNTSGNNAVEAGTPVSFIPLLYRKAGFENGYDSGVQVVNTGAAEITPQITLTDRDSGDRIGPIALPADRAALQTGEAYTWYLPAMTALRDGRLYSAQIELGGAAIPGASLAAIANHVNVNRKTGAVYPGAGTGDAILSAPLVMRTADTFNTGIQIQNLGVADLQVTVRFRAAGGTVVDAATRAYPVPPRNSATVYLPAVTGLPEGFTGVAEITATGGQLAAVVNTVRYK